MSDFLSLPTYLAQHFKSNWMLVLHQFFPNVEGNPSASGATRIYFNGELSGEKFIVPKLMEVDASQPAVLVLGIKDGKGTRTAAAIWGEAWNGLPAKESKPLMEGYTIPTLNEHWVDWDDLLPGSIT